MGIINSRMTFCIGGVVPCSGCGRMTGSCAADVPAHQAVFIHAADCTP